MDEKIGFSDLAAQVAEKQEELQRLTVIVTQRQGMLEAAESHKRTVDALATFIGMNYQSEIGRGLHGGRSLEEVVTGYLTIERKRPGRILSRIVDWLLRRM